MSDRHGSVEEDAVERPARYWVLRGIAGIVSVPPLILVSAFIGFGALARDTGLDLGHTVVMTGMVWALPAQIVLIGAISAGTGIAATIAAVTLSSVRLLPMTMSVMPLMRTEKTPRAVLLWLSHYIAVTAWVEAMRKLPALPRSARVPYFAGFGTTLILLNLCAVSTGYLMAAVVPPQIAAGLAFLTPVYFLISLSAAAQLTADRAALALGLVFGPVFHLVAPEFDLMWTGLVAGTLAFLVHRWRRRR
ncbi:MAG TPA: AzlC family ABC transporter permease [Kaistiaceae bacterium]|nr:AzlC family ABC transporter permease [Kaistiaceae bacterium]